MKTVYRVLAYVIAALVAVQAAAIGYAVFAQLHWIEGGGTLDEASFESVPGFGAYIFHALNGAVALVLFGVAVTAAMRSHKPAVVEETVPAEVA